MVKGNYKISPIEINSTEYKLAANIFSNLVPIVFNKPTQAKEFELEEALKFTWNAVAIFNKGVKEVDLADYPNLRVDGLTEKD